MDNKQDVEYLADLFYLALEAECAVCSNRLSDAEGSTEAAMRSWADRVAKAAHLDGWRVQDDQPVCMVCFQSKSVKNISTIAVGEKPLALFEANTPEHPTGKSPSANQQIQS